MVSVSRQTWSFTPAADEATYLERLQEAVEAALDASTSSHVRLVIHDASARMKSSVPYADASGSCGSNRSTHWARQAGGSQDSPK